MDPTKQKPKSDNNNLPEKLPDEISKHIGRLYECSFCKRGFTNAQALGGHMNIHRKEKSKAKQDIQQAQHHKYYSKEDQYYMSSSSYFPPVNISAENHHQNYHCTAEPQSNYQGCLPPPNPPQDEFPQTLETIGENEACSGVNLSLQIGTSSVGDGGKEKVEVERNAEVDLELRLGIFHP